MQLRGPQCLIGINIADATDHPLVQQHPFDFCVLSPNLGAHGIEVKRFIKRVPRDVCHRIGNTWVITTPATGTIAVHQIVDRQ